MEAFDVSRGISDDALVAADRTLSGGGLVVLPTDTVYGVATRPDIDGATATLFAAKTRSWGLTLPVLVSDPQQAEVVALLDDRARVLAARFWPGPLTIVVSRTERSAGWELGAEGDTVGVRVPDHPVASALLARTGPLAVTSANRSGEPTPTECGGVRAALGEAVDLYLCAGRCAGAPSTVVELTGPGLRILRWGAIPAADVESALA
jgi:tRNA threonylcarbamoyl adenosine modification protein (Sua5/YciO/YrdC/YwlC family)